MGKRRSQMQMDADAIFQTALAGITPDSTDDPIIVLDRLLNRVRLALFEKLADMQDGQGLAIVYRVEVVNADGTLANGPSARSSPNAVEWRAQVFERDGFRCQDCDSSGRLHAHHIVHWADDPTRRYDLSNGVTLCTGCHAKRHPGRENLILASRAYRGRSG